MINHGIALNVSEDDEGTLVAVVTTGDNEGNIKHTMLSVEDINGILADEYQDIDEQTQAFLEQVCDELEEALDSIAENNYQLISHANDFVLTSGEILGEVSEDDLDVDGSLCDTSFGDVFGSETEDDLDFGYDRSEEEVEEPEDYSL